MIIAIEGNIGAGKSTLLSQIRDIMRFKNVAILPEPIEQWTLLDKFYKNKKKYAFSFQIQALLSRYNQLIAAMNRYDVIIVERSMLTDRHIFARMLHDDGFMSDTEAKIYRDLHDKLVIRPDHTFYLGTDVKTCFERMKKRNRASEKNVPSTYLTRLERYHLDLLGHTKKTAPEIILAIEMLIC